MLDQNNGIGEKKTKLKSTKKCAKLSPQSHLAEIQLLIDKKKKIVLFIYALHQIPCGRLKEWKYSTQRKKGKEEKDKFR